MCVVEIALEKPLQGLKRTRTSVTLARIHGHMNASGPFGSFASSLSRAGSASSGRMVPCPGCTHTSGAMGWLVLRCLAAQSNCLNARIHSTQPGEQTYFLKLRPVVLCLYQYFSDPRPTPLIFMLRMMIKFWNF